MGETLWFWATRCVVCAETVRLAPLKVSPAYGFAIAGDSRRMALAIARVPKLLFFNV